MDVLFKTSSTFASLSLKDLLEARDLFHYHLMNKKNVTATAIGLYRIRKSDPWPSHEHPEGARPRKPKDIRRTLFNSEVRPYSWPCVYVFVSSWEYEADLAETDPSDVVPKSLYLPDGRTVPVCVIEARQQPFAKDLQIRMDGRTPRNLLGPGAAIVNNDSQGVSRLGTAGCIVRDGERYYVLTNRHVIGAPGTKITALQTHREIEIGVSARKGLTREDFHKVYPHFQSTNQRLLMDIGLIEIDDILQWKTAFPDIAPVKPVLDFYDNSLSLQLITMKVVGQAAVSGLIRGEIHALFYRYKAMGGSEYLSDFLIGPETYGLPKGQKKQDDREEKNKNENVALGVHHGDSGTLLFIERKEKEQGEAEAKPSYYPFALLWGKEEFFEGRTALSYPFALATSLSTALDRLDLDMVRDINLDQEYVWGWVGHYAIGRSLGAPTDLVTSSKLQAFIAKNLDLLALEPDKGLDNNAKVIEKDDKTVHFVPLADVPDNVWKSNVNFTMVEGDDGKKHHKPGPGNRGKDDNKNHFADLDMTYQNGKTFLEMNVADPDAYLNPEAWVAYFAAMQPQYDKWAKLLDPHAPAEHRDKHWGALPFRVHQLFDIMVKAAKAGNQDLFLSAGGVIIHYLGDACQPLHASYLSQGNPARVVKRPTVDTMILEADGVHSGYEDDMIAYGVTNANLAATLKSRIGKLKSEHVPDITTGNDAAKAVIALIDATQNEIEPKDIVSEWVKLKGKSKKDKAKAMWDKFGDDTVTCMARGTRYLAKLWQGAWDAGNGDANIGEGGRRKESSIMDIYNDPDKLPSIPLDHYPANAASDWSTIKRTPATPGQTNAAGKKKGAKKTARKAVAKKTAVKKAVKKAAAAKKTIRKTRKAKKKK